MPTQPPAPCHILAIDNDPTILDLFRDLLEEDGFRVSTQPDVDHDLEGIKQLRPDLIILDYRWTREDTSWSRLQLLRMDPDTKDLSIVLCTGAVGEVEALAGPLVEMGVRVVLKPFNIDQLTATIAEALRGSGAGTGELAPADG